MRQSLWQQFFRSRLDIPELPLDIQKKGDNWSDRVTEPHRLSAAGR